MNGEGADQHHCEREADERREEDEENRLGPAGRDNRGEARLGNRRAGIAADEGVRRARRQAVVPGDEVPDDCAGQACEDDGEGDDFDPPVPQQRHFQERQPYNPNQPQPFIPQNAFPQVQPPLQPAAPAQNGSAPFGGENFTPGEGGGPRRRRRRPMSEPPSNKGFNGRHAGPGGPSSNGAAPGGDPTPDEAAS